MKKVALITGITGQDSSYLSEFLLEKDYKVYGIKRRSSTDTTWRIEHLLNSLDFEIIEGDITDPFSVNSIVNKIKPDELYNLAAMSHVYTSFDEPAYTFEVNAKGPLYLLESIRHFSPVTKFYQASTSELFANNYDIDETGKKYQDENTKLNPNSPYSLAKLAAHYLVDLYKKSYNIYACAGILHNHETLSYRTPIIFKRDGYIDIRPIGDVARFETGCVFDMDNNEYQGFEPCNKIEVWDDNCWTKVKYVSGYKHKKDKNPRIVNSRNFIYEATGSHVVFLENGEKETKDVKIGDKVKLINYPQINNKEIFDLDYAEFLGMLVGDGNLNHNIPRFTNKNTLLKKKFGDLWIKLMGSGATYEEKDSKSGFTNEKIGQIYCYGKTKEIDYDIYTNEIDIFGHKTKKIPKCILNSNKDVMEAFLVGYNNCDGLKAGYGKYRFKNFKTNSMTLAAGLLYLVSKVTGQKYNITVEESWKWGKQQFYYSINLLSDKETNEEKYIKVKKLLNDGKSQRQIHRETGISRTFIRKIYNGYIPSNIHVLELCNKEVKKIIDIPDYEGWFFDLETESGTFHAGIGQGLVHNSPRRGEEFVTRKITKWIAKFNKWSDNLPKFETCPISYYENFDKENYIYGEMNTESFPKLRLGNINAYRDWGHSKDYVRAMWLMLQQEKPDNFVISTDEPHSVKDFCKEAFECIKIDNWEDYIVIDPKFYRPLDVDYLCGKSTKARTILGWKPEISFSQLVKEMVETDIDREGKK